MQRVLFEMACVERGKEIRRSVRLFDRSLESVIAAVDKLGRVENFLRRDNPFSVLMNEGTVIFEVDDVGMLLVGHMQYGFSASVHVTFWDKRLRGREKLCRGMAELVMTIAGLRFVWCAIPSRARAVLAFAKRVGFVPTREQNGVILLQLTRRL